MHLGEIFDRFPDQESCVAHLERVRWGDEPHCPHCGSLRVARKRENHLVGRWNCHGCRSSFNVLSKTVMEKTKIPLRKWFQAISLMVNAKKSLSSHQLARDVGLNQRAALFMQERIRASMQERIRASMMTGERELLEGIVEADETYVGGKPRKGNRGNGDGTPSKRGRGTNKVPGYRRRAAGRQGGRQGVP